MKPVAVWERPETSSLRLLSCAPGKSLRFQPTVKLIDPMIAGCAVYSQAEAMAAGAENVDLGFVARYGQRIIKLDDGLARLGIVLRPREKQASRP